MTSYFSERAEMTTGRASLVYMTGLGLLQSAALLAEQSATQRSGLGELLNHRHFSLIVFGALTGGFAEMLAGFQVTWLETPRTMYSVVTRLFSAWLMGIAALPWIFEQYFQDATTSTVFFFSAISAGVVPQAWAAVRAMLADQVKRTLHQEDQQRKDGR